MLKILFWTLLAANAALFGYQWYGKAPAAQGREPMRVAQQLNADKLHLLPAPAVPTPGAARSPAPAAAAAEQHSAPASAAATSAAATGTAAAGTAAASGNTASGSTASGSTASGNAAPVAANAACAEIGDFDPAEARRFEARLANLGLGERLERRNLNDRARFIVYIANPDQASAEARAEALRRQGLTDLFVIHDDPGMRWAISLGIFRSEAAAQTHVATLTGKGVHDMRIAPFALPSTRIAYQLHAVDGPTRQAVEKTATDFPQQNWRACGPPANAAPAQAARAKG